MKVMKKILIAAMAALLLLSCSGNDVYDKVIAVYENAAEEVLTANSKEECRALERKLNAECSKVLREYGQELAELQRKADDGNRRSVAKLAELNEAKRLYRENKAAKRATFR